MYSPHKMRVNVSHKPLASLRTAKAFRQVYKGGRHVASPLFVVYARKTDEEARRLGLSVSKKVGNAVVRNRVRRWIKEYCRIYPPAQGYDYIVVARPAVALLPQKGAYAQVKTALAQQFKRLAK
ncbi:MAG: ribonuclease P protein component [Defluviitaleaceae bacterium]|nr:ribonuclease P protein component [Defluviitaleaceae bacterium]MCL2274989.1 ribonuclease P protein component [Defluviitaleaceae bacterium]